MSPAHLLSALVLLGTASTLIVYLYSRKTKSGWPVWSRTGTAWPQKRLAAHDLPPEFQSIEPYNGLPINRAPDWPHPWKPGKFQMTMSLRKVDPNNWLTYDSAYEKEHLDKLRYMNGELHDDVVQVLPNTDESCEELLQVIVEYIVERYPDMFQLDGDDIVIVPMNERYRVRSPYDRHPMELAGLLVTDDLYVLHLGELDKYYLRACFLACPSGWRLKDRIGWPLHQMHGPVPTWREKLQKSMEKFFLNIKVNGAIQRNNVFVQPCPGIFHQHPMDDKPTAKTVEDIEIRTELQSLRRLPRTGAVIFTVRTYMNPLTDLGKEPMALNRLWDAVRNYPEQTAAYKVRHLWYDVFEGYCRSVLGRDSPDPALLEEED